MTGLPESSTAFKLIAGITSTKTAIKLVCCGLMFFVFHYAIQKLNAVLTLNLPEGSQYTIIVLLGIGIGSLSGSYINYLLEEILKDREQIKASVKAEKEEAEKAQLKKEKNKAEENQIIENFKSSVEHMPDDTFDILRTLYDEGKAAFSTDVFSIMLLKNEKYIIEGAPISFKTYMFTLNPIIIPELRNTINSIADYYIDEFYAESQHSEYLISLFMSDSREKAISLQKLKNQTLFYISKKANIINLSFRDDKVKQRLEERLKVKLKNKISLFFVDWKKARKFSGLFRCKPLEEI